MALKTDAEMLQFYQDAEIAVLEGKTVSYRDQSFSLEDLETIVKCKQIYERRVRQGGKTYSLASSS